MNKIKLNEYLASIPVSEEKLIEREKIAISKAKQHQSGYVKQKKRVMWKKAVAVAFITLTLSAILVSFTHPTYAGRIPIIGNIFKFGDEGQKGLYSNYKENAHDISMTKESNGIRFTINDAVYDGKTVFVTYSIESDRDLGENPFLLNRSDIEGSKGMTGSSEISRVDNNSYVGIDTYTNLNNKEDGEVQLNWKVEGIIPDTKQKVDEIKGHWNFNFSVKASQKKIQLVNNSVKEGGIQLNIEKIGITPMSFIIYYDQNVTKELQNAWDDVYVDLTVKDDLGNIYTGQVNGGTGTSKYNINWTKTFQKLDEKATKLIVTPTVELRNYTPENHGGLEIPKDQSIATAAPFKDGAMKDITLPDIIISLQK